VASTRDFLGRLRSARSGPARRHIAAQTALSPRRRSGTLRCGCGFGRQAIRAQAADGQSIVTPRRNRHVSWAGRAHPTRDGRPASLPWSDVLLAKTGCLTPIREGNSPQLMAAKGAHRGAKSPGRRTQPGPRGCSSVPIADDEPASSAAARCRSKARPQPRSAGSASCVRCAAIAPQLDPPGRPLPVSARPPDAARHRTAASRSAKHRRIRLPLGTPRCACIALSACSAPTRDPRQLVVEPAALRTPRPLPHAAGPRPHWAGQSFTLHRGRPKTASAAASRGGLPGPRNRATRRKAHSTLEPQRPLREAVPAAYWTSSSPCRTPRSAALQPGPRNPAATMQSRCSKFSGACAGVAAKPLYIQARSQLFGDSPLVVAKRHGPAVSIYACRPAPPRRASQHVRRGRRLVNTPCSEDNGRVRTTVSASAIDHRRVDLPPSCRAPTRPPSPPVCVRPAECTSTMKPGIFEHNGSGS